MAKLVTKPVVFHAGNIESYCAKIVPYEPGVKGTNRKTYPGRIRRYTAEMLAGFWRHTHQGIGVNTNDQIEDGQHRLLSFREALRVNPDLQITMNVTTGLEPGSNKHMDTGAVRRMQDFLSFDGRSHTPLLASAARMVWCYFEVPYVSTASWARLEMWNADLQEEALEKYPSTLSGVERMAGQEVRRVMLQSAAATAYAIIGVIRPEAQREVFFHKLITGQDMGSAGSPVYELREKLLGMKKSRSPVVRFEQLALMIKGFNAFADGVRIERAKLRFGVKDEFPRVKPAPIQEEEF